MSISDTIVILVSGIGVSAVSATLMVLAAEKTIAALERRARRRQRAKLDAARREDLRQLIARAEARGIHVPESLRSAAA